MGAGPGLGGACAGPFWIPRCLPHFPRQASFSLLAWERIGQSTVETRQFEACEEEAPCSGVQGCVGEQCAV